MTCCDGSPREWTAVDWLPEDLAAVTQLAALGRQTTP